MKNLKLYESFGRNSNHKRVIPRDLFNESKVLKCYARLVLKIHDGVDLPCEMSFNHDGSPFDIGLNQGGDLTISNIEILLNGQPFQFHTTYNNKTPYPMFVMDESYTEYVVFDDDGDFTEEFIEFCQSI